MRIEEVSPMNCSYSRVELFGTAVDAVTMDQAVDAARAAVAAGGPHQHVVLNAAKVVAMQDDPELAGIIRGCDFIQADGASVVWFSKLARRPVPERVAGADLFEHLVGAAAADGTSVYFLGAQPHVVERVVEIFTQRWPDLRVAGFHDGFWSDDAEVVAAIRDAGPDYLFLAIPSPRKEYWLATHLDELETTRAPRWMQKIGMEWSWRLIQEPRRMFKRYLVGNTRFLVACLRELRRPAPVGDSAR